MNVTCDNCGKRYVIPDEKLAGKSSVKIRCKQCQSLVSVRVNASSPSPAPVARTKTSSGVVPAQGGWEAERTRAMPPMDLTATWYAMIKGVQHGPLDVKALQTKVASGEITLRTYLWKPGMDNWKRASDVSEVSPVFAGVSVGATATGPARAAPELQKALPRKTMIQYDVAVANEVPTPAPDPAPRRTATRSGLRKAVSSPAAAAAAQPQASQPQAQPRQAQAQAQRPLDDLFNDISGLNGTDDAEQEPETTDPGAGPQAGWPEAPAGQHKEPAIDPFAMVAQNDGQQAPAIGEATRFFIAQAGVNKRNPWWKKLLFVVVLLGLPVALLYALASFRVVPMTVTRTNAEGKQVEVPVFSGEGMAGLKDMLNGDAKRKQAEAARQAEEKRKADEARKAAVAARGKTGPTSPPSTGPKPSADFMAAFYGNSNGLKMRVPRIRREDSNGQQLSTSGLSEKAVSKVVADKMKSFESCIEQSLRRNPNLAVGNIVLSLTVGTSGAVKSANVSPKKWEGSDWAQCMMGAGKRIVFPSSDGETELELPFKIGVSMQ